MKNTALAKEVKGFQFPETLDSMCFFSKPQTKDFSPSPYIVRVVAKS
jgi:hypothetical protein